MACLALCRLCAWSRSVVLCVRTMPGFLTISSASPEKSLCWLWAPGAALPGRHTCHFTKLHNKTAGICAQCLGNLGSPQ